MARLRREHGFALRLAACALLVAASTAYGGAVAHGNLIWVANGVLLAYLILTPRSRWLAYLGAGLLGHLAGALAIHTAWAVNAVDTPLRSGRNRASNFRPQAPAEVAEQACPFEVTIETNRD